MSGLQRNTDLPEQCATFYINNQLIGIDIRLVREINRSVATTPVPHAAATVRGVINLRGDVLTILDVAARLGLPHADVSCESRIVIVNWAAERIGLFVDRVGDVVRTAGLELAPPPANLHGWDRRMLVGVCRVDGELLVLLETDLLLRPESPALQSA